MSHATSWPIACRYFVRSGSRASEKKGLEFENLNKKQAACDSNMDVKLWALGMEFLF